MLIWLFQQIPLKARCSVVVKLRTSAMHLPPRHSLCIVDNHFGTVKSKHIQDTEGGMIEKDPNLFLLVASCGVGITIAKAFPPFRIWSQINSTECHHSVDHYSAKQQCKPQAFREDGISLSALNQTVSLFDNCWAYQFWHKAVPSPKKKQINNSTTYLP